MSALHPHPWGVLHLLVAHNGLTEGHVYRCYLALCGALLPTSELPPSTCPDDCEFDVLYCSECVRVAAQWTAEAQRAELESEALDEPNPQVWITYVGDCGHHRVMSNPAHIGPCPDCDAPDPRP